MVRRVSSFAQYGERRVIRVLGTRLLKKAYAEASPLRRG
jgi:hypothetical protein